VDFAQVLKMVTRFVGILRSTDWGTDMPSSKKPSDNLDFDRDIPTTDADIKALRDSRPTREPWDLRDINSLAAPDLWPSRRDQRSTFPDQPPFEL